MFRVISCQEETAASHIINFWQKWEKALRLTCADESRKWKYGGYFAHFLLYSPILETPWNFWEYVLLREYALMPFGIYFNLRSLKAWPQNQEMCENCYNSRVIFHLKWLWIWNFLQHDPNTRPIFTSPSCVSKIPGNCLSLELRVKTKREIHFHPWWKIAIWNEIPMSKQHDFLWTSLHLIFMHV